MIIIYFVPVILIVMALILGGSIAYWVLHNIVFIGFLFVMSIVMSVMLYHAFENDNKRYLGIASIIAIALLFIIMMYTEHITGSMTALGRRTEINLKNLVFGCIAYFLPAVTVFTLKGEYFD